MYVPLAKQRLCISVSFPYNFCFSLVFVETTLQNPSGILIPIVIFPGELFLSKMLHVSSLYQQDVQTYTKLSSRSSGNCDILFEQGNRSVIYKYVKVTGLLTLSSLVTNCIVQSPEHRP